jgi:hypothetical protein
MLRRKQSPAFLYAFDLLELDGEDLRRQPIEERKRALAGLLKFSTAGIELIDYLQHNDADAIFRHSCRLGMRAHRFEAAPTKEDYAKAQKTVARVPWPQTDPCSALAGRF